MRKQALPKSESVWEYPRPPRIESIDWRLEVHHGGRMLAATTSGLRILETSHPPCYYFPSGAVDFSRLLPSNKRTFCEWKGYASYWNLVADGEVITDVCWAYQDPADPTIKDYVSFYAGRVEACIVAGERVQPQEGDFYGGWISSWVQGPFKGGPGTRTW